MDFGNYVTEGKDFPLSEFRERHNASSQSVGYGKSLMVFHMLRKSIGDSLFWVALRDFYRDARFTIASWKDVEAAFSDACGEDLSWYFDQWVTSTGMPEVRLGRADYVRSDSGYAVTFTMQQSSPPFVLDLPFRIETTFGTQNGSVTMRGLDSTHVVKTTGEPLSLAVDPDYDVFRRLFVEEMPMTLGALFGEDSIAVVIGSHQSDADKAEMLKVARAWRLPGDAIIHEEEFDEAVIAGKSLWLLGRGRVADRLLSLVRDKVGFEDGTVTIEGAGSAITANTMLFATRNPDDGTTGVGFVISEDTESLGSLAPRIPHYGRYSYVGFAGTKPVVKGVWREERSPLFVDLSAAAAGQAVSADLAATGDLATTRDAPAIRNPIATADLAATLQSHVAYLASDSLEGRLVGTRGIEEAAAYIASQFEEMGLGPAFEGSYYQDFKIQLGMDLEALPVVSIGGNDLSYPADFAVLPISGSGSTRERMALSSADAVGAVGRSVAFYLVDKDIADQRWTMTGRDGLLDWMEGVSEAAHGSGAQAVVFVSGSPDRPEAALHWFPLSRTYRPLDLPVLEITYAAVERSLAAHGLELEDMVGVMSQEGFTVVPPSGAHLECTIEVSAAPGSVEVRNVGAVLPGMGGQYAVIGAHYDHLGYGDIASSSPWRREVHNGADDNASGVAALIEIARQMVSRGKPLRSVVFLAFTAEELGALGSGYYCKHPPYPIDSTVTMINLDTVGRLEDDPLIVFGAKSAEEFSGLLAEACRGHDLEMVEKKEIYGFSDQNPFYARGMPALHLFTGAHDDYHSPDDDWDKIDFRGFASITSFAVDLAALLVSDSQGLTPVIELEKPETAMSRGRGAHLGIIPDFAHSGTGVGIKGTVPGSPAEEAGLVDGDVLVGIDNEPIADLRGLMGLLAGKGPGDDIEIQVMRGSSVVTLRATLSVRSSHGHSD
jgi:hypothetical protein